MADTGEHDTTVNRPSLLFGSVQDARGDQCDNCGNLLNPTELLDPVCKLTGTRPVLRTTKHLFLDLPRLSQQLQKYIDTTSDLGGWTSNCLQVKTRFFHEKHPSEV